MLRLVLQLSQKKGETDLQTGKTDAGTAAPLAEQGEPNPARAHRQPGEALGRTRGLEKPGDAYGQCLPQRKDVSALSNLCLRSAQDLPSLLPGQLSEF